MPCLVINGGKHPSWMEIIYEHGSKKEMAKSEVPIVEVPENILAKENHLNIRRVFS